MTGIQKAIKIGAIAFAITIILSIISLVVSIFSNVTGTANYKTESFTKIFNDNIREINIDINASNLTIEPGEKLEVIAENVRKGIKIKEKKGVLTLSEKSGWFFKSQDFGDIIIKLPNGTLNKLDIDSGAGKLNINNISVNALELDQGAGLIDISSSTFNSASIDGGAGKFNVTASTLNNLDFSAGVGQVNISGIINGRSEIECGVGELNLNLKDEKENYSLRIEKGIGNINIDGKSHNNGTYGIGKNVIDIEGGIGAININFK